MRIHSDSRFYIYIKLKYRIGIYFEPEGHRMHKRVQEYEAGLPIGFRSDAPDKIVLYEEAVHDPTGFLLADSMSNEQCHKLALARIAASSQWPERLFFPGGVCDRSRALEELKSNGELSDLLVQTEVKTAEWVINKLVEEHAND